MSAPASPPRVAVLTPFQRFFALEASGGLLLLACAVVAVVWANSAAAPAYVRLFETVVTVGFGEAVLSKPFVLWINDGLMALFFFVVGLEIKREVLVGELRSPRKAALALAGAVGGMAVPAALYALVAAGTEGAAGWGIPMATDIAFALGVLALVGRRAPLALKVFLTALAIADDLGAVLVIALFYTAEVSGLALGVGLGTLALLAVLSRSGVRRTWVYVVLGLVVWVAFLKSGVHATVAGVLVALTVPARRLLDEDAFARVAQGHLDTFRAGVTPGAADPDPDQRDALHALEASLERADAPLFRMEHALHPWVTYAILPLFALANAGVALGGGAGFGSPVTLGVLLGLVVGKPLGVLGCAWAAVRLGLAALPEGVTWRQVAAVSVLTGIGFTMSLFVGGLAFGPGPLLDAAKTGILLASALMGVLGYVLLRATAPTQRAGNDAATAPA